MERGEAGSSRIESTGSRDRRITSETSCSRLDRRPPSSLPGRRGRHGVYTHHTCGPPPCALASLHLHLCTCVCDRLPVREPPSPVYRAYLRLPLSMGTGPYVLWIRTCRFPSPCPSRRAHFAAAAPSTPRSLLSPFSLTLLPSFSLSPGQIASCLSISPVRCSSRCPCALLPFLGDQSRGRWTSSVPAKSPIMLHRSAIAGHRLSQGIRATETVASVPRIDPGYLLDRALIRLDEFTRLRLLEIIASTGTTVIASVGKTGCSETCTISKGRNGES